MTKESGRQKQDLETQIREVREKISNIDEADAKIEAEDFAAGVKELDQELVEEEEAANFNPDVDARDYDDVAKSLPMFCVSSRATRSCEDVCAKKPMYTGSSRLKRPRFLNFRPTARNSRK
ncbi:uncharacterized protein P174DRAFT_425114 [Aspergillus novofumigatus IBT 16806]|uniref:Uncharacterized protein n=1 Tax=Aspergillus novofumigatus (strain IBT 16806) TaxID=1392255 RepID=A0A2I1BUY0_ASPN1|nr:uncharacterized protein P174DRAFT_425114 [Aspergillus novofumigatus IBT 16806]PKX89179.1 hypothetical protein P174DRAFT_425114 [Aspergillus novofumigatus IBT 16806]